MGALTTHALDTMNGCPAAGMPVALYRLDPAGAVLLKSIRLNADGRGDGPLLGGADFATGRYRLLFEAGAYFRARGAGLPDPAFLESIPIDFGVADANAHYHVPLLLSPWSFSTYRGS